MEKSFYHIVDWAVAQVTINQLKHIGVPFAIEQPAWLQVGQIAVSFPDLPIRQYGAVLQIFENHGHRYPGNLP